MLCMADFTGKGPAQKLPGLEVQHSAIILNFVVTFDQEPFCFALGPASYVASPGAEGRFWMGALPSLHDLP